MSTRCEVPLPVEFYPSVHIKLGKGKTMSSHAAAATEPQLGEAAAAALILGGAQGPHSTGAEAPVLIGEDELYPVDFTGDGMPDQKLAHNTRVYDRREKAARDLDAADAPRSYADAARHAPAGREPTTTLYIRVPARVLAVAATMAPELNLVRFVKASRAYFLQPECLAWRVDHQVSTLEALCNVSNTLQNNAIRASQFSFVVRYCSVAWVLVGPVSLAAQTLLRPLRERVSFLEAGHSIVKGMVPAPLLALMAQQGDKKMPGHWNACLDDKGFAVFSAMTEADRQPVKVQCPLDMLDGKFATTVAAFPFNTKSQDIIKVLGENHIVAYLNRSGHCVLLDQQREKDFARLVTSERLGGRLLSREQDGGSQKPMSLPLAVVTIERLDGSAMVPGEFRMVLEAHIAQTEGALQAFKPVVKKVLSSNAAVQHSALMKFSAAVPESDAEFAGYWHINVRLCRQKSPTGGAAGGTAGRV